MTKRDWRNSRPFNTHRWSYDSDVDAWIDDFWHQHLSTFYNQPKPGPQPKSSPRDQFKVLMLDLYLCWRDDPEQCLGVSHDKGRYPAESRYNALPLTPSVLFELIRVMRGRKLIKVLPGHTNDEGPNMTTRVWPRDRMIHHFESADFNHLQIGELEGRETIILRKKVGGRQELVPYRDPEEAQGDEDSENVVTADWKIPLMRKRLETYNNLLRESFIDVACLEEPYIRTRAKDQDSRGPKTLYQRISQHNKSVRRMFNRASFEDGGRFYGGFWQRIGSELRSAIRIDDQPTVELDYSAHHIRVAYANEDLLGPDDPYDLGNVLPEYEGNAVLQRKDVKSLTLICMNAKSPREGFSAFRGEVKDAIKAGERTGKVPSPEFCEKLLNAFIERNPEIEAYMNSDKGIKFMNTDSRVSDKIIDHFVQQDIPILCVHDSYIVPAQYEDEMREQMTKAFKLIIKVSNPYIEKEEYGPYTVADGYKRRWDEFQQWKRNRP